MVPTYLFKLHLRTTGLLDFKRIKGKLFKIKLKTLKEIANAAELMVDTSR